MSDESDVFREPSQMDVEIDGVSEYVAKLSFDHLYRR